MQPTSDSRRPSSPRDSFDGTLGYPGEAPALAPRNAQDRQRQTVRAKTALPEGRPVLAQTEGNRKRLLKSFDAWLRDKQLSVSVVISSRTEVEELVRLLNDYRRELFSAGLLPFFRDDKWDSGKTPDGLPAVTGRLGPCLCVVVYGTLIASRGNACSRAFGLAFSLFALGVAS